MGDSQPIVLNMQYALFGFSERLERPDFAWDRIKKEMPDVFDMMPAMIPQLEGGPEHDDIPVVHLNSTGPYSMDIARRRVDFYISGRGRETVAQVKDKFLAHIGHVQRVFAEQKPQRLGFVVRVFYESSERAAFAERLLSTDFSGAVPGSVETLAIRRVAGIAFHGLSINSVTTVATETMANIAGEPEKARGVQVTRDFNNVPGQSVDPIMEATEEFVRFGLNSLALEKLESLLWTKTE